MSVIRNVVAAIGGKNENEKTSWIKLGVLIETNDGKLRLKIDALPRDPSWDGWASVFDDQERQGQTRNQGGRQYPSAPPPRQPQGGGFVEDTDIPF
jgi:hypothetical protein